MSIASDAPLFNQSLLTQLTDSVKTLNISLITSLGDGCEPSIATDTTKISCTAGFIYVTNHSDRGNATGVRVAVAAQTVAISAFPAQRVQITSAGILQVIAFTGNLTLKEKINGLVQIAVVSSPDSINASAIAITISALYGSSVDSNAALFAEGTKILTGGTLELNSNLTMDRVVTKQFDCFAPNFYNDPKDAYEVTFAREEVFSFTGVYQDGGGGSTFVTPTANLNVNFVDDGTGTLDALSGNEAQNFRVYEIGFVGSQNFLIEHGQVTHASLGAAVIAAVANSENHNTSIFAIGTIFRGYISVARAVTNLFDDAVYTKPRINRSVSVFS